VKAVLIIAALATTAVAEPIHQNTVSVELSGFSERGLIIDGERDLPALHISIDAGLVLRASATGDYSSRTLGIGGEVRYWFKRRAIWTRAPRGSAIGWYAGGRIDLARTSLEMDGASLGRERQFATSLLFGYRFAPWRGLEVRPYTGLAIRREWDASNRVAAWTKAGLVLGFAVGWSW
jgi:hypothetical protein